MNFSVQEMNVQNFMYQIKTTEMTLDQTNIIVASSKQTWLKPVRLKQLLNTTQNP